MLTLLGGAGAGFETIESSTLCRGVATGAESRRMREGEAGQVAPLREALSLLLYSRALEAAKNEAGYVYMESMLNLLTKLERLKPL